MKGEQVSLVNYSVLARGLLLLKNQNKILPVAFLLLPSVAQAQGLVNTDKIRLTNFSSASDYQFSDDQFWDLQKEIVDSEANLLWKELNPRTSDAANWEFLHSTGRMFDDPERQFLPVDLFGKSAKSPDSEGITGGLPKLWVSVTDINDDDAELTGADSPAAFLMAELPETEVARGAVESGVYRSLIAGAKLKQFNLWSSEEKSHDSIADSTFQDGVGLEKSTFFPGVFLFLEGDRQSQEDEAGLSPVAPQVKGRNFSLNNFAKVPEAFSPSIADTSLDTSLIDREVLLSENIGNRLLNQQYLLALPGTYKTVIAPETPYVYQERAVQQPTHPLQWEPPTYWQMEQTVPVVTTQRDKEDSNTFIAKNQPTNLNSKRLLIADFDRAGDREIPNPKINLVPKEISPTQSWQSTTKVPDVRPHSNQVDISPTKSWQSTAVAKSTDKTTPPEETIPRKTPSRNGSPTEVSGYSSPKDAQSLNTSESWPSLARVVDPTTEQISATYQIPERSPQLDSSFLPLNPESSPLNPESSVALMPPPIPTLSLPVTESVTAPKDLEFPQQNQSEDLISINSTVLDSSVRDPNNRMSWFKVYSSLIDLDVQKSLGAIARETNSMPGVLYVLPSADYIELMLMSPGQPIMRRIVTDANGLTLNATVQELIAEVTNPRTFGSDRYLNAAQQLYQWLILPIETELNLREIDTLMFALDPSIRSLPVAVLHDGQQFLVEKYRLSLIPSLNLTDLSYHNLNQSQVLAMGASQFADPKIQPLDQVQRELSAIGQNRSGQVFINEAFTPENLALQSRQGSYDIVHLATHVEFNPEEEENSYIQFFNSRLTLDRVQEIGWQNQSIDLLVLSGCETAFGNENAYLGFAGLAVQNGVKSVVASLWQVDDRGTLGLMSEFYHHLSNQDQTIKAEALRQAQLAMLQGNIRIDNHGQLTWVDRHPQEISLNENPEAIASESSQISLAHPYFWAAFTLVGNPW